MAPSEAEASPTAEQITSVAESGVHVVGDIFTIKAGTESDYSFIDENGKYWKITLDPKYMTSDSSKISWAKNTTITDSDYDALSAEEKAKYVRIKRKTNSGAEVYDYYMATVSSTSDAQNTALNESIIGGFYQGLSGSDPVLKVTNGANVGVIKADVVGNKVTGGNGVLTVGYNATVGSIIGNFSGNMKGSNNIPAIQNSGITGSITGNFIGNSVNGIYNGGDAKIGSINAEFIDNGRNAIENIGEIGSITGSFRGHTGSGTAAGTIYNYFSGVIGDIKGDFTNNKVVRDTGGNGAALYNEGTVGDITGDFVENEGTVNI
ncbi:MAG: hypothetical protein IKN71_03810 [Alphaproteobacteria bacterium]|nr:hypothetical protein [Alphaproteobacteria bacterium]